LAATASTPQALEALEAVVAQTWRTVLGRQEVGREINFFDLGGHSLAVIQVQRRLREACGVEIPVTDMFRLTTISSLARHLAANSAATAAPLAASTFSVAQDRAMARRALRNSLSG
jgi:acyl carrier protein